VAKRQQNDQTSNNQAEGTKAMSTNGLQSSTALTPATPANPYAVPRKSTIVGDLLLFTQNGGDDHAHKLSGEWVAGRDKNVIPHGTKIVIVPESIRIGYVLWEDDRIAESHTGLVCEGFVPPVREELSHWPDSEKDLEIVKGKAVPKMAWQAQNWPEGPGGGPNDPWRPSWEATAIDEDGNLYTISFGNQSAINAANDFQDRYSKAYIINPNMYPVVELWGTSYQPRDTRRRRVKKPILKIVSYEPKARFVGILAQAGAEVDVLPPAITDQTDAPAIKGPAVTEMSAATGDTQF
jgi:hypothetical protein